MRLGKRSLGLSAASVLAFAFVVPAGAADMPVQGRRPADDTGVNVRDRGGKTVTPDDQSNREGDVELTRQVRQAIVKDDSLSTNAHNVKIISQNGVVTLRGPVASEDEKASVAAKAREVRGVKKVDNQLEVAKR